MRRDHHSGRLHLLLLCPLQRLLAMAAFGDLHTLEGALQQMGVGVKMGKQFLLYHVFGDAERR